MPTGYHVMFTMQCLTGCGCLKLPDNTSTFTAQARASFPVFGVPVNDHVLTFKIRQSSPVEFWEYLRSHAHRSTALLCRVALHDYIAKAELLNVST